MRKSCNVLNQLLEDPSQTHLFFEMIEYTCKSSYQKLTKIMIDPLKGNQALIKLYERKNKLDSLDVENLKNFPEPSLGYQYAYFLTQNKLDINFYPKIKIRNILSYTKNRLWETHDIWHVVCGYDTSMKGETAMQAFILAQITSPLALAMLGASLIHFAVYLPEEITEVLDLVIQAYNQGKIAVNLLSVDWDVMFPKPLDEVRELLNITRITAS